MEPSNLHRQWLFEEADAAEALPKAAAAGRRIARINSSVRVRGVVADLTPANVEELLGGAGRHPGRHGQFRDALPDQRFRREPRHPVDLRRGRGQLRADHAGDSGPHRLPALRLSGAAFGRAADVRNGGRAERDRLRGGVAAGGRCAADPRRAGRGGPARITTIDVWSGGIRQIDAPPRDPDCPCLRAARVPLPGRDCAAAGESVRPQRRADCGERPSASNLAELRARLEPLGEVRANEFALRFFPEPYEMTIFPDGRAIIKGTSDTGLARSLYAKYVG